MIRILTALFVVALLPTAARAEEHPLKNAKVGDWIEYRSVGSMIEQGPQSSRLSVTAVSPREITYKLVLKQQSQLVMDRPGKVRLDQEFDPASLFFVSRQIGPKAERSSTSGEEEVTIAEKKVACKWLERKATQTTEGQEITVRTKIWLAKEGVPLGGMVKLEAEIKSVDTKKLTVETTGWGAGK